MTLQSGPASSATSLDQRVMQLEARANQLDWAEVQLYRRGERLDSREEAIKAREAAVKAAEAEVEKRKKGVEECWEKCRTKVRHDTATLDAREAEVSAGEMQLAGHVIRGHAELDERAKTLAALAESQDRMCQALTAREVAASTERMQLEERSARLRPREEALDARDVALDTRDVALTVREGHLAVCEGPVLSAREDLLQRLSTLLIASDER